MALLKNHRAQGKSDEVAEREFRLQFQIYKEEKDRIYRGNGTEEYKKGDMQKRYEEKMVMFVILNFIVRIAY